MLDAGDQNSFIQHWTSAQPAVAGYIRAVVRDSATAKDLLQETAMVLFRKFAQYDGERPFLGWALGVAKFQVLGHRRDEARSFLTFEPDLLDRFTLEWAAFEPEVDERAGALEECLDQLKGRAREVVRMRYFEDLTAEEIAKRAGTNGSAVRVMLQRIREQLRACISDRMRAEGGTL
jgi:RNA polymerase sigma-70 factor, ECF subfamily